MHVHPVNRLPSTVYRFPPRLPSTIRRLPFSTPSTVHRRPSTVIMLTVFRPTLPFALRFIASEQHAEYTYTEVGQSRTESPVAGFDNDINSVELGQGTAVFAAAQEAVRQWRMFPGGWALIMPDRPPVRVGEVVGMAAKVVGIWWLNTCRIVYTIENEHQFGFAYGTLPGHAECGEELFIVEKDAAGVVRYRLRAFSKPRHWMARLAYPLARRYQRKFVRDSKASMQEFVKNYMAG